MSIDPAAHTALVLHTATHEGAVGLVEGRVGGCVNRRVASRRFECLVGLFER